MSDLLKQGGSVLLRYQHNKHPTHRRVRIEITRDDGTVDYLAIPASRVFDLVDTVRRVNPDV